MADAKLPTTPRKPRRATSPRKPAAKMPATSAPLPVAAPAKPQAASMPASLRRLEWLSLLLCYCCFVVIFFSLRVWYQNELTMSGLYSLKIEAHNEQLQARHKQTQLQARLQAEDERLPDPVVLASVVKFNEGEESRLQTDLVGPLLSYYDLVPEPSLLGLLIERKNASSRDVTVRLFMDDGTEISYLWPSTHSFGGVWKADCVETVEEVTVETPMLCPEGYELPKLEQE